MGHERDVQVYLIGHGHIDPVWLWRWNEGLEEVRATFRTALDLLDTYPELRFTATSAAYFEWISTVEPRLVDRIRPHVESGRWEIAGMWVEPDCNQPSGESLVRQGLYAQRYFQQLFGRRADVALHPDSFGHPATLPQILCKLGIRNYLFMRPAPGRGFDASEGLIFDWIALDGSHVTTAVTAESHKHAASLEQAIVAAAFAPAPEPHAAAVPVLFAIGNNPDEPSPPMIEIGREAAAGALEVHARFSTLAEFFCALGEAPSRLPKRSGGLRHYARGCYSAHARFKRMNRQTEHALLEAERFATAAWLLGVDQFPDFNLGRAWRNLLFNQYHDLLAGTCIPAAYRDAMDQMGAARHRARRIIHESAQAIARDIDTTGGGNTLILFNPLTWPVRAPVVASTHLARGLGESWHLADEHGEAVICQAVPGQYPGDQQYAFVGEVPAMGYRCYYARPGETPVRRSQKLEATPTTLESDAWCIELDPDTGTIARLFDRQRHIDVLNTGATLAVLVDGSDTWSHGVSGYRAEAGRFGGARLRLIEQGSVRAGVRAVSRYGRSRVVTDYLLYRELDIIEIRIRVDWHEPHHVLKLGFETRLQHTEAVAEVPYGHELFPTDGTEQPCQQWVALQGTLDGLPYGLGIVNDGCFAFDAQAGALRMTLLRSPAYAHHERAPLPADGFFPVMDIGEHEFRLRLVPFAGNWEDARIVKQAWELNLPALAHLESAHPGIRPAQATLLGTEADNVLLSVLKKSEDGEDIIVRGYEIYGRPAETRLHVPAFGRVFDLHFSPYEIKTLRINRSTWEIQEVNLLEE